MAATAALAVAAVSGVLDSGTGEDAPAGPVPPVIANEAEPKANRADKKRRKSRSTRRSPPVSRGAKASSSKGEKARATTGLEEANIHKSGTVKSKGSKDKGKEKEASKRGRSRIVRKREEKSCSRSPVHRSRSDRSGPSLVKARVTPRGAGYGQGGDPQGYMSMAALPYSLPMTQGGPMQALQWPMQMMTPPAVQPRMQLGLWVRRRRRRLWGLPKLGLLWVCQPRPPEWSR